MLLHLGLLLVTGFLRETVNQWSSHTGDVASIFLQLLNLYCWPKTLGTCFGVTKLCISLGTDTFSMHPWRTEPALVKWMCAIKTPEIRNRSCWYRPDWYRFLVTHIAGVFVSRSRPNSQLQTPWTNAICTSCRCFCACMRRSGQHMLGEGRRGKEEIWETLTDTNPQCVHQTSGLETEVQLQPFHMGLRLSFPSF